MAITENIEIKSVTTNLIANEIFVIKERKVWRDLEEIASVPLHRYFNSSEVVEFLSEVPNGSAYIQAMGW